VRGGIELVTIVRYAPEERGRRDDPLEEALEGIVSGAAAEWKRLQGDTPDVLYHHTDVAGLIGICSSRSLWATNLRFMNDARELAHSRKLMIDVLGEAMTRARLPAQLEVIQEIKRMIVGMRVGYPDSYSVSFSADGDLLSQWRAYGSSGGGYAIGFDTAGLVRPPSTYPQPRRFLHRVIYDEETPLGTLRRTADAMLALFACVDPDSDLAESRARVFSSLGELVGFTTGFKDPSFAEEKEWRAVYVIPHGDFEQIRFRPSNGVAVPYINLKVGTDPEGKLPIREVVQGPRVDSDTGVRSLELLLAGNGYPDVAVTASAIPLRP
jgi:hypothetical protein